MVNLTGFFDQQLHLSRRSFPKCFVFLLPALLFYASVLFGQIFTRIETGSIVSDGGDSFSSSWGDYDNDGYLDLFVANCAGEINFLYRNTGNSSFVKITVGTIVNEGVSSHSGSWGDYDNDGDLDLFVANHGNNFLYANMGDGQLSKITISEIVNEDWASNGGSWTDYDSDGYLDLFVSDQFGDNDLFRNNGDGAFSKITTGSVVSDGGHSITGSWADYDNDGDLDLFVANLSSSNFLYQNTGNGSFIRITNGDLANDGGGSIGGSWGDYDNDGDLDLFVTNSLTHNFLYQNNGDGTFMKITAGDIVQDDSDSRGSAWGDYDNDGDLDLFVANSGTQNFLYQNNGDGTFSRITEGAVVTDRQVSRGCSWGDYDNDGDLDLFVSNREGQNNALYRNNGNDNNWINIKCIGAISNRSAIGTKIRVKGTILGASVWQMRKISGQTGAHSQNSLNAEFGLGDAAFIDSVRIEWPSGIIEVLSQVPVNQFLTIVEESGPTSVAIDESQIPQNYSLSQNYPNPFNPETKIQFQLPNTGQVVITIFNALGQQIRTLIDAPYQAGFHTIRWDGKDRYGNAVSSGIYFYYLQAGDFSQVKKMSLLH
jgi:hypothetical protein